MYDAGARFRATRAAAWTMTAKSKRGDVPGSGPGGFSVKAAVLPLRGDRQLLPPQRRVQRRISLSNDIQQRHGRCVHISNDFGKHQTWRLGENMGR